MADDFDKRFRKFDKMQRLLDGEDASMSMVSNDLPLPGVMSKQLADEAFALLAHRTQVRLDDCESAEEVANRVRRSLERPLREENEQLRAEVQALQKQVKAAGRRTAKAPGTKASRAELLDFQARLVVEAAEAVAAAAEGHPGMQSADPLAQALRQIIDRVMLFHRAEDLADGGR